MPMRIARTWIPLAFVATVLCGFVYGGIQQVYRNAADDPQIQMAEVAAAALAAGAAGCWLAAPCGKRSTGWSSSVG